MPASIATIVVVVTAWLTGTMSTTVAVMAIGNLSVVYIGAFAVVAAVILGRSR